ncbi:MAG: hypothetical protein IPL53_07945 [Ignavibacteria bacterium]|nr:hypothetical protein [Ignavibacteria bacterium]
MNISKGHDEILKKDFILFEFRTKKVFENYAYRINIIPKIDLEKKEIQFNIEGLSAPLLDISKESHAIFEYRLFDFKNTEYNLKLMKYAKGKILLKFKVSAKGIKLTLDPQKKFINVFTEGN